jgi:two-component system sensor kinase FixL
MLTNLFESLSCQILCDASADAILFADAAGRIVYANQVALSLLEYSAEQIQGLDIEALMPARHRSAHLEHREAFNKNPEKRTMGNGRNLVVLTQSGQELSVDIALSPLTIKQQLFTMMTLQTSMQRQQVEQALHTSEERLRLAKQAAGLGIFDFDPQQNIIYWDENMCAFWGEAPSESISYEKFIAAIHIHDMNARQNAFERAANPMGSGEYKVEYRVVNARDGSVRWIATVGRMHFEHGQMTRLIGVAHDVTEQRAYQDKLQKQRAETEAVFKQQVAARTVSAIAHELNQPLAALSAYSEVAMHALQIEAYDADKLKRALKGCVEQAHRAGQSLHELLAFLLKGEVVTEKLDINHLIKEAMDIVQSDGYGEFKALLKLEPDMPPVLGNKVQIQKVLVNLFRNAVEAMRSVGIAYADIHITARTDKEMCMAHICVEDTGPGLDAQTAQRIFEPFFTTKSTGIGMGLVISRALIEANGGQLWFEPNTKVGATFHFTLPFAP